MDYSWVGDECHQLAFCSPSNPRISAASPPYSALVILVQSCAVKTLFVWAASVWKMQRSCTRRGKERSGIFASIGVEGTEMQHLCENFILCKNKVKYFKLFFMAHLSSLTLGLLLCLFFHLPMTMPMTPLILNKGKRGHLPIHPSLKYTLEGKSVLVSG